MSNMLSTPKRKWIAASAMAMIVAAGTLGAGFVNTQPAIAQQVGTDVGSPPMSGFADLVESVSPAVVSVQVSAEVPVQQIQRGPNFEFEFPDLPEDHPLRRFFDQFEEPFNAPNPERPNRPRDFMQAVGSGFIISADGYIVTNNHVVQDASEVTVLLEDDTELAADIIGTDPRTDLALLKVREERNDLPFVEFATEEARVGDWVVAVGNPFGLGGTVTAGIVSARGRDINASYYDDFLQIDAAVNRGNSGGPSFNTEGDVVGVNTAIFSPSGGNVGIAFAIPAALAQNVISQLQETGFVTRGFLGVSLQDLNDDLADALGLANANGALVTQPIEGAPAADAGVESGDVIVSVNGQGVSTARELSRVISQQSPGSDVDLGIIRNGDELDITVTLDRLEEDEESAPAPQVQEEEAEPETTSSSIGVTVIPNEDGEGLVVDSIEADSAAASRGLMPGDVIEQANGGAVSSPDDFEAAIDAARSEGKSAVSLRVSRDGVVRFVGVPLDIEE
ncbi:Do family serine endopeptidase [Pelagibacterium halotolerans]|uniref:Probable periplasmic serine endoprotease DegP-like n=1 Tax=Pelagibacterium halotolerans (strain DSM 22347 / JCM 15775 / CGMCC 1.7692 / B2) TaxID=1082931 RepID=G4RE32_PELHB|nr:Do family serine endopeptidase [Pelagibacterium halotolerans]AEQ50826.1 HtrA protease/chaperone protein [Pelagibacterium halotolerans B2]QJR19260.1 Do family serine endopeptidase [Pelagibacterium halotolerans]SDZ97164.1 serine protease Do [Pelagibacterium halotolerans]